jgi:hypothetical protein
MAITKSAIRNNNGITFTLITDSSADWSSVPNSTYFKDLSDGLIHYKDATGTVLEIFSPYNYGMTYTMTTFNYLT